MKNFIKRITDRIRRKPLLVKPVVSGSFVYVKPKILIKQRSEQEYTNKVSELLKQCKEWRQVYRLYKLTCNHFNWVEGNKVYGMTQVVLSMEFQVLQLKAQLTGL
jgi:hypothetical protein